MMMRKNKWKWNKKGNTLNEYQEVSNIDEGNLTNEQIDEIIDQSIVIGEKLSEENLENETSAEIKFFRDAIKGSCNSIPANDKLQPRLKEGTELSMSKSEVIKCKTIDTKYKAVDS